MGDERGYNQLAFGLLHGEGFNWPNRVPFYPAFLAVEHWAVHGYDPIPYIGAVVGTLVVPGTYLLGRRLAGTAAGLIAAAAVAFSPPLVDTSATFLSEVLFARSFRSLLWHWWWQSSEATRNGWRSPGRCSDSACWCG